MTPVRLGALVLAGVFLFVACGGGGSTTHTISGTVTLTDDTIRGPEDDCYGGGGYDDLRRGAGVVIRNGSGETLQVGSLKRGTSIDTDGYRVQCKFRFKLEDIDDAKFYSIEVAGRGEVEYSKTRLEDDDWIAHLSIGQ